ncbi:MAG: hypothetical protein MJZ29_11830 [Bacteroidaceae bacterium]|nr:hypothetical protein [Bacteroidaceae bacterium]
MQDIHKLIEAYFDCTLSEQEEQQLKQMLATTEEDTADVREAKAVLGVFAMERKLSQGAQQITNHELRITHSKRSIVRYAAAAVAVFAIVIGGMKYVEYQEDNACVMYVNGEKISNEKIVLAQMVGQMDDISEAADYNDQTMFNQLDDMASVLE